MNQTQAKSNRGNIAARHFVVSGRVQGVGFRYAAQSRAEELNLFGWVRNLPDGTVEAVARGEAGNLAAFEKWLWIGPKSARVISVIAATATAASDADADDFRIRR